jgi:hypothetical protein
VVELVDDHDVEVVGRDHGQIHGRERLDRREDMVPSFRSLSADQHFAE